MNITKYLKGIFQKKEIPYVAKTKAMLKEGKNIPFTKEEVKSLPLGFTPTGIFYNRKNKNYNPQTSKFIGRNSRYNMPKIAE